MSELDQLRADLAVLKAAMVIYERDYKGTDGRAVIGIVEAKIRKLEAEQADPWRGVKTILRGWWALGDDYTRTEIARYFKHLTAENARLAARVAELEGSANLTPVSLKRADEIRVGDRILGGGKIRTVTDVLKDAKERSVQLSTDLWSVSSDPGDLFAVVNGAMGEGETRPLKKGCDDGK